MKWRNLAQTNMEISSVNIKELVNWFYFQVVEFDDYTIILYYLSMLHTFVVTLYLMHREVVNISL